MWVIVVNMLPFTSSIHFRAWFYSPILHFERSFFLLSGCCWNFFTSLKICLSFITVYSNYCKCITSCEIQSNCKYLREMLVFITIDKLHYSASNNGNVILMPFWLGFFFGLFSVLSNVWKCVDFFFFNSLSSHCYH